MNPALRKMYGLEVRRTPKRAGGKHLFLGPTAVGRLFALARPGDPPPDPPRPVVVSRLRPLGGPGDPRDEAAHVAAFLGDVFYDDVLPRLAEEED